MTPSQIEIDQIIIRAVIWLDQVPQSVYRRNHRRSDNHVACLSFCFLPLPRNQKSCKQTPRARLVVCFTLHLIDTLVLRPLITLTKSLSTIMAAPSSSRGPKKVCRAVGSFPVLRTPPAHSHFRLERRTLLRLARQGGLSRTIKWRSTEVIFLPRCLVDIYAEALGSLLRRRRGTEKIGEACLASWS